jgi:hypothetical protein
VLRREKVEVTIRVKTIEWGDQFLLWRQENTPVYPGVDGAIRYELKFYRTDDEMKALKAQGIETVNPYVCDLYVQPFSRKGTYTQEKGGNVWAWDGNKDAPTLSPSFALDAGTGWRVHLFFQNGKINLCSDSTVKLEQ